MSLTEQERYERDPAAIQQEILEIEKNLGDMADTFESAVADFQAARGTYEVLKCKITILKERRSALQSVLRTLQ